MAETDRGRAGLAGAMETVDGYITETATPGCRGPASARSGASRSAVRGSVARRGARLYAAVAVLCLATSHAPEANAGVLKLFWTVPSNAYHASKRVMREGLLRDSLARRGTRLGRTPPVGEVIGVALPESGDTSQLLPLCGASCVGGTASTATWGTPMRDGTGAAGTDGAPPVVVDGRGLKNGGNEPGGSEGAPLARIDDDGAGIREFEGALRAATDRECQRLAGRSKAKAVADDIGKLRAGFHQSQLAAAFTEYGVNQFVAALLRDLQKSVPLEISASLSGNAVILKVNGTCGSSGELARVPHPPRGASRSHFGGIYPGKPLNPTD